MVQVREVGLICERVEGGVEVRCKWNDEQYRRGKHRADDEPDHLLSSRHCQEHRQHEQDEGLERHRCTE